MSLPGEDGAVITARKLARWYGPVIGLTDVTVDIPSGIIGLLGPNGAGKSTLMRLLTGQIWPSHGSVRVLGRNPVSDPELYRHLGFVSEDDSLFEGWTAMEFVTYLAKLSGHRGADARERGERSLERCGIQHAAHRRVGGFSKGMRQRTRLAGALVHDPVLLLLDEPMTGLDPVGRRAVVDLIEGLADEGRSVIFASHILYEVEALARYVVVMNRGMVLAEGSMAHLEESLSDYAFTLEVVCSDPRRLAAELVGHPHVVSVSFAGEDTLRVATDSARQLVLELPGIVLDLDLRVSRMTCPEENLESLFKKLVQ